MERDNPFDPVNVPARPVVEPKPVVWIPDTNDHVKVVLPDSLPLGSRNPKFIGTLGSALSARKPGDTIWVYGGGNGREYLLSGTLKIIGLGSLEKPLVILTFGGRVKFRLDPSQSKSYQQYCLLVENSHLRMVGFDFDGGVEYGIKVGAGLLTDGSIDLDSVNIDHSGLGIEVSNLRGPVRIRNMVIRNYRQNIAVPINFIGDSLLDTSNIYW
ncbi:MAG: hypothetical protein IPK50_12430 [Fibrobacterota bacterium]|nr:MAG: hypothetical protein IPK50_12430 [Fibrobacterota bacterium]